MIRRLAASVACAAVAAAANPFSIPDGASGYKLLKTLTSPRSQALSGAGVAEPGLDAGSNPALDSTDHLQLSAGWVQAYGRMDGSYQEASWVVPWSNWTWEGRALYAGFGDIPGRDGNDLPTGTYAASTWAVEAGASIPVSAVDGLRAGLVAGGGSESVSDATSIAGWASAGLRWAPSNLPWAVGIAVRNLGETDNSDRLPVVVQGGASWTGRWGDWTVVPMADVRLASDEDLVVPLAVEVRWNGAFLRSGFAVGQPEARPSFGVGFQGDAWGLDAGLGWHAALGFAPSGRLSLRF